MVVSEHRLATDAGIEVLRAGGNAVDGACATAFALAVVYPVAGNLGGGGFLLYRDPSGEVQSIDFRERAPAGARRDMFLDAQGEFVEERATLGHLAAGVPGSVAGLHSAHQRCGKLPWKRVLAPAIRLAREGFAVDPLLADDVARHAKKFARFAASRAAFLPGGEPLRAGQIWTQPDLARTLERIAERGAAGFYRGEVAECIAAEMRRGGGLITTADLAEYRARWREPVSGSYRGYRIHGMAPPSSGGVLLLQMLGVLEHHDLAALGHGSARYVHLLAEVMGHAYADRATHLGDPDHWKVPTRWLHSAGRVSEIAAGIDLARRNPAAGCGAPPRESKQTTHLSAVAPDGGAVSLTTTINTGYGCKVVVAGAGFLLNNEMDDFSAKPGTANSYGLIGAEANAIAPGKRMLSSMTPTIVERDGELRIVVGTPGGSRIITSVLQVMLNLIDHEMGLAEAVAARRIHHQWRPDRIDYERGALSPDTRALLEAMGYELRRLRGTMCSVQAITRDAKGRLRGFGDLRRGGYARGF
jgi:gamma-glutamyltranspeptidase/glutathione hydrolase